MTDARRTLSYLRHLDWYLSRRAEVPLSSDLDATLPLPDLSGVCVAWPVRYAWPLGGRFLELVKRSLERLVPVVAAVPAAQDSRWRAEGGFPVPAEAAGRIGTPHQPKGPFDIRGEVFEVLRGSDSIRCAYDYSDYPLISTEVAGSVHHYFKCVAPPGPLPAKALSVGYFSNRSQLLAKARARALAGPRIKDIDVYARFGTWTDGQGAREVLVERLRASQLRFHGGFGTLVFPAYMKELLRAKIALDAPGQAPITCRLPEAMALGAVVVSAPPACVFPENLIDGVHYAATNPDSSDVVEVCRRLLDEPEKLARIATAAGEFFDRNFSPQSIARRILRQALA